MTEYYIKMKDLAVGYQGNALISDINLKIKKGEIVTLIGPNGAGKSTVMGMISRLIANDAGIIEFQGKSMHDWKSKELAKHLAILTQSNNIQMKLTVEELVAFVGDLDKKVAVYTTEGKLIEETTHDQWWLRDEEFEKVVEPYIKEHLHNY